MTVEALSEIIEHNIDIPQGVYKAVHGDGFLAQLGFSAYNKRISILDYHFDDVTGAGALNNLLESICIRHGFTKVWGKIPANDKNLFLEQGFVTEASLKGFFSNQQDAIICSRFFDQRQSSGTTETNDRILQQINNYNSKPPKSRNLPPEYRFKFAEQHELETLAALYRKVFITYPYPIYDPDYLESNLAHTVYGLVYKNDELVAAAAAEINYKFANSEMTDFASLPAERGQGLASIILEKLENRLSAMGVHCLYTIARSTSLGMNLTFSLASYRYSGTLINNCNISGGFEDMNVFYKHI